MTSYLFVVRVPVQKDLEGIGDGSTTPPKKPVEKDKPEKSDQPAKDKVVGEKDPKVSENVSKPNDSDKPSVVGKEDKNEISSNKKDEVTEKSDDKDAETTLTSAPSLESSNSTDRLIVEPVEKHLPEESNLTLKPSSSTASLGSISRFKVEPVETPLPIETSSTFKPSSSTASFSSTDRFEVEPVETPLPDENNSTLIPLSSLSSTEPVEKPLAGEIDSTLKPSNESNNKPKKDKNVTFDDGSTSGAGKLDEDEDEAVETVFFLAKEPLVKKDLEGIGDGSTTPPKKPVEKDKPEKSDQPAKDKVVGEKDPKVSENVSKPNDSDKPSVVGKEDKNEISSNKKDEVTEKSDDKDAETTLTSAPSLESSNSTDRLIVEPVEKHLPEESNLTLKPSSSTASLGSISRFKVEPVETPLPIETSSTFKPSSSTASFSSTDRFEVEPVETPLPDENNSTLIPLSSLSSTEPVEKPLAGEIDSTLKPSNESNNKPKKDKNVTFDDGSTSGAGKLDEDEDEAVETVFFLAKEPLVKVVTKILKDFEVPNVTKSKTENDQCYQIIFVDEKGEKAEKILNTLAENGVGVKAQTSVSIYQSKIFRGGEEEVEDEDDADKDNVDAKENEEEEGEFKKSIKARMLVTEVVDSVRSNAVFTFDYLLLIILASIISALGLVENSSITLVASMLISPLMGPILAGTFGTVIKNNPLRNLGIKSESAGLLICTFSGFCFGLITGGVNLNGARWGSTDMWPSSEMSSRGMLRSLWVGALIALPSGAGVALSVLGGNTGSLVGVAISASLLPPAVNAGMLWAYAFLSAIKPPDIILSSTNTLNITSNTSSSSVLQCPSFVDNKYVPVYNCNMAAEAGLLGLVSLSLTLLNIICIFLMAIIVLKIKEVAPQAAVPSETRKFWAEDLQIARDSYATAKGADSLTLAQQAKEFVARWRREQGGGAAGTLRLKAIMEDVENSSDVKEVLWKLPTSRTRPFTSSLHDTFREAEDEFVRVFGYSDDTYVTYHGRGSIPTLSPTHIGALRRTRSLTKHKPKSELSMVNEAPPSNLAIGSSNLFRRRKKDKKEVKFEVEPVETTSADSSISKNDLSPLIDDDLQDTRM